MKSLRAEWLEVADRVLAPTRAGREQAESARSELARMQLARDEARGRALAACERRIEDARALVFAARDGVVGNHMTDLERHWRILSRPDPDAALMDLWSRLVPGHWVDRKRWRDSAPADQAEVALALAADPTGVDAAERAASELAAVLGRDRARLEWRLFEGDASVFADLLTEPLARAEAALARHEARVTILERARSLEGEIRGMMFDRLPDRPALAHDVAHAAYVDYLWQASGSREQNPADFVRALLRTGYVLASAESAKATLALPRL